MIKRLKNRVATDPAGVRVVVTWILAGFALVSLAGAIWLRLRDNQPVSPRAAACILIPIALVPPLWFWIEWAFLCDSIRSGKSGERESQIHMHDLARNVWVALLLVLAYVLDVGWFK